MKLKGKKITLTCASIFKTIIAQETNKGEKK